MMRCGLIVVSALVTALVLGPGVAAGAPSWLTADVISSTEYGNYGRVQVGLDAAGTAIAVWSHDDGANQVVRAAVRPAHDRAWQSPQDISVRGSDAGGAQVVVSPDGTAVAIWTRFDGTNWIVQAATRPASTGGWQAPLSLSATGRDASGARVAVGPDGNVMAIWSRFDGAKHVIQSSVLPAASGTWTTPQDVSAGDEDAINPRVALGLGGSAIATWIRSPGPSARVRAAARSQIGGAWHVPQDVSGAGEIWRTELAVAPRGDAVALWTRGGGSGTVEASLRSAFEGVWLAPESLSPTGAEPDAHVSIDVFGTATAVWSREGVIQSSTMSIATGVWTQAMPISGGGASHRPDLAAGPHGETIAIWARLPKERLVEIEAAVRLAGSPVWGSAQSISHLGSESLDTPVRPSVVFGPLGDAVAAWPREGSVEAAGFDGAGPRLESLIIPEEAVANAPSSFSVKTFDAWSSVASTQWDFGDGTVDATGPDVSHAFTTPGTYDVTVTAFDDLGNRSQATSSVRVLTAPSPEQVPRIVPGDPPAAVKGSKLWPSDRDGDGTPDERDRCPDEDARTRDHDGNGCRDFVRLRPVVKLDPQKYIRKRPTGEVSLGITVRRLTVSGLPRGAQVALRCTRRACQRETLRASLRGKVTFKRIRGRRLRIGVLVTLRVTAKGAVGEGTTYVVLANRVSKSSFCIHPSRGRSCRTLR